MAVISMSRDDAESKLYPCQWGTEKRKEFIEGLVALGLLHIEPDDPLLLVTTADGKGGDAKILLSRLSETLQQCGWLVLRDPQWRTR